MYNFCYLIASVRSSVNCEITLEDTQKGRGMPLKSNLIFQNSSAHILKNALLSFTRQLTQYNMPKILLYIIVETCQTDKISL